MRKTILITGASSGLGAEMARQFAARGHDLALCARRTERLDTLVSELRATHPGQRFEARPLDVDDHEAVFNVFEELRSDFGSIDRVVVNAGVGNGVVLGTGGFEVNRGTAQTNFVSALAQVEAALGIFRKQNAGHLVLVSSMSAMRGMPRAGTTYAATKAALAHLGEGLQVELAGSPIKVSVLFPGYIRSEMNMGLRNPPFIVSTEKGVREMVEAIEKERPRAEVPAWPWRVIGVPLRHLPLPVVRRLLG